MATNVMIGIPAYGNTVSVATLNTTHALLQMFMSKGVRGGLAAFSYPEISEARNIILTGWYDTCPDATHLLFIDSDMGFSPQVVVDMLMFNEPMVGAIYSKKTLPVQWAASGLGEQFAERRGDFMKVAGLGMGCFLIRRDVVTTMLEKMPELSDTRMEHHVAKDMLPKRIIRAFDGFDNPDDTAHGRMSEDLSFCCRWRQCGGEIWAAIGHEIEHVGQYSYKANYMQHIAEKQAAGELTAAVPAPFPALKCKHGTFTFNPNDTFIGRSLQHYGEWCEFELDLLGTLIKPGDTVIDVGAYIGTHTVAFSKMVGPSGHVMAFEPQPRIFKMLEANLEANQASNVMMCRQAAGERVRSNILIADLPPDNVGFNFGAVPLSGPAAHGITTQIVTVDSLNLSPSVIKIDVEGMEPEVIAGAHETIKRCQPILYLENNGDDSAKVATALEAINYRAYWSIGPYFNPNNFFGNKVDIWPTVMPSVNLIAVPMRSELRFDLPMFSGALDCWKHVLLRKAAKEAAE